MRRKSFMVLLVFALTSLVGFQAVFASGQFHQGAQYHQGAYDLDAQSPTPFNWDRVSRYVVNDDVDIPQIKWEFHPNKLSTYSTPAIGADGTIYNGADNGYFYALNPDGSVKWITDLGHPTYKVQNDFVSPVIAQDGSIIVSTSNGLYSLNSENGTIKWGVNPGHGTPHTVTIDEDGNIYLFGSDKLFKYTSEGSRVWVVLLATRSYSPPSIASDGTIYIATQNALHALNSDGTEKWRYPFVKYKHYSGFAAPSIAPDGTILIGADDHFLHAINPDGTLKWKFETDNDVKIQAVFDADGTIYFGSGYKFYALNPDGTEKWKYDIYHTPYRSPFYGSPIIDAKGDIYTNTGTQVLAFTKDGTLKWTVEVTQIRSSISLAADGTIYVGVWNGGVVAIGSTVTDPPIEH